MTGRQRTISKSIQAASLLSLIAVVVLTISGVTPFQQIATAMRTIVSVATDNSNDLLVLGVMCAGAGIFVMSHRRRRARGRQASS
jgi:hypothetical protein